MRWVNNRLRRQNKGAALVEMALILPLLMLLVFGIIEFGWMLRSYQAVASVAREGCRNAALGGTSPGTVETTVDAAKNTYDLDGDSATVAMYRPRTLGDAPAAGAGWKALPPTEALGTNQYFECRVEVTYTYSYLTGGMFSWMTGSTGNTRTLRSNVVMRREV